MVVESRRGRAITSNTATARRLFTIYHLLFTLQQAFRRVHAYQLRARVYLDADALGERDEVFAALPVAYDEHVGLAARVQDLSDCAERTALDCLGAAAFELPVVELALFQLDRLRLRDRELAARERRGLLGRVVAAELQHDAVAVEPVAFQSQPRAPPARKDRYQLF